MQRQGPKEASLRRRERGPARVALFPGHLWKVARLLGRASPGVLSPGSGWGGTEPGEEAAVSLTEPGTWEWAEARAEGAVTHRRQPEPQVLQNVGATGEPGHRTRTPGGHDTHPSSPPSSEDTRRGRRPRPEQGRGKAHLFWLPSQPWCWVPASVRGRQVGRRKPPPHRATSESPQVRFTSAVGYSRAGLGAV